MMDRSRAETPKERLHDLGGDAADPGAGQADRAGSARGEGQHAAADERAAIVDGDDDAAVAMGHLELGTERQGAAGGGHSLSVHALAASGFTPRRADPQRG